DAILFSQWPTCGYVELGTFYAKRQTRGPTVPDAKHLFVTNISGDRMPDPGLFTWDMNADLMYADGALAELFGLDPEETERGLPVQTYLDRVHPDDVAVLAKQISDAIVAQHP